MSLTPNMNMTLPTPSSTVGPDWANKINTALTVTDDHDHSSGKGKKVTPAGLDINTDLDINTKNLINVNTMELINNATVLSGVSYACTVQFAGGNFYIVNSGGTSVKITEGGNIVSTVVIPASPLMPAGTVLDFAGSTIPPGFLSCNGNAVSRTTYPDLFNSIGTAFGVGDGATTFNLPNFNGRTSVGSGTYTDTVLGSVTRSLAQTMGAASHVLTEAQMPSHNHTQAAHSHDYAQVGSAGIRGSGGGAPENPTTQQTGLAQPAISYTGGAGFQSPGAGIAHNNMQPSLAVNKMIKT